ncbi:MAG TPA: hypothetical protein VK789_19505 [Bryobacteraceae bacterium]|jgi:hypothetical protein|nr:hypothetical protein [Bryobacteraceae bacterium]
MDIQDSRRGGVLLGLLVSALVAVCLVAAFGMYVASQVKVTSHDRPGSGDVSIELPGGAHFSVHAREKPGAAVAGVPVYPGSRPDPENSAGGAVIEWGSERNGKAGGIAVEASSMITDDAVDKVADYYHNQLPNWMFETKRNGEVHMELHEGGYKRIIAIDEKHGRTHIGVATVGEPASN